MAGFDLALTRLQQNTDQLLVSDRINELALSISHGAEIRVPLRDCTPPATTGRTAR